jgi:RNase P/RNase MRP subunit p30
MNCFVWPVFEANEKTVAVELDLSKITRDYEKTRLDFLKCHLEILDKIRKEMKALRDINYLFQLIVTLGARKV